MKTTIQIFAVVLICASCKVMYIPNSLNVPLMKEKNEVRANISFYDYQIAYAPTKNIGLMVNGYVRNSNFSSSLNTTDLNYATSRNLFEGGIGYFKPLSEGFIFETYVGGGVGNVAYNSMQNTNSVNYKYSAGFTRFFIQPSIGYAHDIVDVAFSARIVRLGFNNIKAENYTQQMLIDEEINDLDKTNFFFIEPALTFRIGYKWGKFQTQVVYSNKANIEPLNYQKFSFNIGLHINIAPRFKSVQSENK